MLAVEAAEMGDRKDTVYHLQLMRQSGFDDVIVNDALHRAVGPIRDQLKIICSHTHDETGKKPENNNEVASGLIKHASPLLEILDFLLPEGDATRESAHDEVALRVRACLISYCNETQNWNDTLTLAREAFEISASQSTRERIKEDIDSISSNLAYATCWFCGKASAENESSVTVMMYGNVQRDRGLFETKVRYQQLPVPVPRCRSCKAAHSLRKNLGCAGPIVGLVLAVLIGIATQNGWVGFIVFGVCWLFGYLISVLAFPKRVKEESYKKEFRTVKEMLSQGWKIGEKP